MGKKQNLSGQTFGKLLLLHKTARPAQSTSTHSFYLAKCLACNSLVTVSGNNAKKNRVGCSSCRYEYAGSKAPRRTKHGMARAPEYWTYHSMLKRCHNPKSAAYYLYGARGISVCERWRESFDAFYADMGAKPEGSSLERIDNEKGYFPENCRWATPKEQANNRRTTKSFLFNGRSYTTPEFAKEYNLPKWAVGNTASRLKCSYEEAARLCLQRKGIG